MTRYYEEVENNILFISLIHFVYPYLNKFYNVTINNDSIKKIKMRENKKGCMYIARHSTHNLELMLILIKFYLLSKKPLRGIGHRLVFYFYPILYILGVEIGNMKTVYDLLSHGENICIMPGGREEMTFGNENVHKCFWNSSSNKFRKGFAEAAYACNVPIIPIKLKNIENMCFAPITFIFNKVGFTKKYDELMNWYYSNYCLTQKNNFYLELYKILFHLKVLFSIIFSVILIIPIPTNLEIIIGEELIKNEDESFENFSLRCKNELEKL